MLHTARTRRKTDISRRDDTILKREELSNLFDIVDHIPQKTVKKLYRAWIDKEKSQQKLFQSDDMYTNMKRLLLVLLHEESLPDAQCDLDGSEYDLFALVVDRFIYKRNADDDNEMKVVKIIIGRLVEGQKNIDDGNYNSREAYEKLVYDAEIAHLLSRLTIKLDRELTLLSGVMRAFLNGWCGKHLPEKTPFQIETVSSSDLYNGWSKLDEPLRKKVVLWTYKFARLLQRLLQKDKDILRKLEEPVDKSKMINVVYENINAMFYFCSLTEHDIFAGRSLVLLIKTVDIYKIIPPKEARTCTLPDGLQVTDCIVRAQELSSDDPRTLYLLGQYCRRKASSIEDRKNAAVLFKSAVDMSPEYHMALHHLGLLHRELWVLECGHPPTKLLNCSKPDNVSKSSSGQTRDQQTTREKYSDERHRQTELSESCQPQQCSSMTYSGTQLALKPSDIERLKLAVVKQPSYPEDPLVNQMPKHYMKPNFYAELKAMNPIETEKPDNENLRKSYEYFKKASDCAEGINVLYLIDLARICICMGKTDEAKSYFDQAFKVKDLGDPNLIPLLYEQSGMLHMQQQECRMAKIHFRKSVEHSVRIKERSRVAFYYLLNLLDSTENTENDLSTIKEKAFIYKLVEDFGKTKEIISGNQGELFGEAIKNNTDILWDLIECYVRLKDYASGMNYLSWYINVSNDDQLSRDKAVMALEIAFKCHAHDENKFSGVFHWIFLGNINSRPNTSDVTTSDDSEYEDQLGEYDILLLSEKSDDTMQTLAKCFEAYKLEVFCSEDLCRYGDKWQSLEFIFDNIDCFGICLTDIDCKANPLLGIKQFADTVTEKKQLERFIQFTRNEVDCSGQLLTLNPQMSYREIMESITTTALRFKYKE